MIEELNIASLHKKLQSNWTSWTVASSITPRFLDDVRCNFDKFEKKAKLKTLISILQLDLNRKSQCATEIKRLLKTASEDSSDEVSKYAFIVIET